MNDPVGQEREALARKFHEIYQAEARRQGDVRHADNYDDLPENIKEFDRVLADYVLVGFDVANSRAEELDALLTHQQMRWAEDAARAEAAEQENERLREALGRIEQLDRMGHNSDVAAEMGYIARRALAAQLEEVQEEAFTYKGRALAAENRERVMREALRETKKRLAGFYHPYGETDANLHRYPHAATVRHIIVIIDAALADTAPQEKP